MSMSILLAMQPIFSLFYYFYLFYSSFYFYHFPLYLKPLTLYQPLNNSDIRCYSQQRTPLSYSFLYLLHLLSHYIRSLLLIHYFLTTYEYSSYVHYSLSFLLLSQHPYLLLISYYSSHLPLPFSMPTTILYTSYYLCFFIHTLYLTHRNTYNSHTQQCRHLIYSSL
jgi:hypothetical protein